MARSNTPADEASSKSVHQQLQGFRSAVKFSGQGVLTMLKTEFDISLEPGIENITDFTTEQSEVDDPKLSYSILLPALSTRFEIPA